MSTLEVRHFQKLQEELTQFGDKKYQKHRLAINREELLKRNELIEEEDDYASEDDENDELSHE